MSEADGTFGASDMNRGDLDSTLSGVYPYARFAVIDRVSAWGLLGYGAGEMTITQAANPDRDEIATRTDIGLRMAAGGLRGELLRAGDSGGLDLALRADGFLVEMDSEPAANAVATEAESSRVRLAVEGSRAFEMGGGSVLSPGFELGLRHDGGDAENGTGLEVGGSILYADPGTGLTVEGRARTLVAHGEDAYEEWGASASMRLAPRASGRGLSFSFAPVWGAASSGVEDLWSVQDAGLLAAGRGGFEATRRLEANMGYGLAGPGGFGVLTPNVGLALAEGGGRTWRTGARWTLGAGASLDLDGTRTEPTDDAPEHRIDLKLQLRW